MEVQKYDIPVRGTSEYKVKYWSPENTPVLNEEQNKKLQNIAWTQSHIVRAPLSRIMGMAELINNNSVKENEIPRLLKHLLTSANELDGIIRNIVKNTEG